MGAWADNAGLDLLRVDSRPPVLLFLARVEWVALYRRRRMANPVLRSAIRRNTLHALTICGLGCTGTWGSLAG